MNVAHFVLHASICLQIFLRNVNWGQVQSKVPLAFFVTV